MSVVVLVPRRADSGHRDALWAHCRDWWRQFGWPIVEGHHEPDEGPFNRSAAVNRAAQAAGDWDHAVIIDSDVLSDAGQVAEALERAQRWDVLTFAYSAYFALDRSATRTLLAGRPLRNWYRAARYVPENLSSCVEVVSRGLWDEVGGFDERFRGWGWEDVAFMIACGAMRDGRIERTAGPVWHLWHPHASDHRSRELADANEGTAQPYIDARYDPEAMRAVLRSAGGPLDLPLSARLRGGNPIGVVPTLGFLESPQRAEEVYPPVTTGEGP